MEGKNNKLVTFDGCDVFSVATDSYATENDLLNIGPVVGRIYDTFPINTCDEYPTIRAVTKDSAVIEWEPTEKTAEYRVDIYTEDNTTGAFAYRCTHSLLSKECALKLDELTEGTNYYVCIVANDETGMELATYNHQSFSTRLDSTELITNDTPVSPTVESRGMSTLAIILICAAGVAVVAAAAATGIILLKNKKARAKK